MNRRPCPALPDRPDDSTAGVIAYMQAFRRAMLTREIGDDARTRAAAEAAGPCPSFIEFRRRARAALRELERPSDRAFDAAMFEAEQLRSLDRRRN